MNKPALTPAEIHKAVYVKLRTLEVSDDEATRIAQAAYIEAVKMRCEAEWLKKRRKRNGN